ncbi:MAG TPA: ABC transporter permease [Pyrinomonadaceae bacterium]|jgi:putative ABC transport system permease protein|nr:ABC transporter permease [Pyrinomonadaceae bacterium]
METLLKDIRYGVRGLLKRPGFTVVAIITLALGIGANTAIFSVVNAVVLRPLPYAEPDRLVTLWETMPGSDQRSVAPGNFDDWRTHNKTFQDLAATNFANFNLTSDGEPDRIDGATITSNLMSVLGVNAQLGRTFQVEDDQHQDRNVVLISDNLWRRRFAADPNVVGRNITLDEMPHTIVGVMRAGFQFPSRSDLWVLGRNRGAVPMSLISQVPDNDWVHERDAHFIRVIGRLKAGVSLSQAQSDIAAIAHKAEQDFPKSNSGLGSNLVPLHTQVIGDVRSMLFILLGAVGFVLLIACTNVANLMLARASQRDREIAIRTAVGASRLRLIRQLLTESLLLSIVGGLAGLLVSIWAVAVFVKLSPGDIPRLSEASVDFRLLGFTLLVSLVTGLGFGLLPAFQATRTNLNTALKEGGTKATEGRQRRGARNVLVATEIALAQILLVGAALLAISYVRVTQINPGFNPDRVLTAKIAPSNKKYPDAKSRSAFYSTVLERLQNLPGVESAGMVMSLPLSGSSMNRGFRVEGRPEARSDENVTMDFQVVSPNYFSTLEIPVKRGRGLSATDTENTERVIVINETMARVYWQNEDPVGKRLAIGESSKDTSWRTIVGVVADNRHASLSEAPVPTAFIAYRQDLESWPRMGFVIKSQTTAASLTSVVRAELAGIDRAQPVYAIEPMDNLLRTSVAQRRFVMLLLGSLAAIALVLAMIGVYGVISFSVSERTQEIGIRMALGARAFDVLRMVLGQGMRVAVVGIAIGLAAAFALTRLLASMLFEVSATDPRTFAIVAAMLAGIALLACYLPARRATKVDPLVALRYE